MSVRAEPPLVHFDDFLPNQVTEKQLVIRNTSNLSVRYAVVPPTTGLFAVLGASGGTLAPGMAGTLKVMLMAQSYEDKEVWWWWWWRRRRRRRAWLTGTAGCHHHQHARRIR